MELHDGVGKERDCYAFLKYHPSLASGPAAALTAVQIQLQLLWTLAQVRPHLHNLPELPGKGQLWDGTHNTTGTERCWQQSQSVGK